GRTQEALTLREQLARTPDEREALALTALRAGRHGDVVRILGPLGTVASLSTGSRREFASVLATTDLGAPIAAQVWALLLAEQPADAEGWVLHAEALQRSGRLDAAGRAAAFGALFTGADLAPAPVAVQPVARSAVRTSVTLPGGALAVTAEEMPNLSAVLEQALAALGAPDVRVWLDPSGAGEAWMAATSDLVLGA